MLAVMTNTRRELKRSRPGRDGAITIRAFPDRLRDLMKAEIAENQAHRSGPRTYSEIVLEALFGRYRLVAAARRGLEEATLERIKASVPPYLMPRSERDEEPQGEENG